MKRGILLNKNTKMGFEDDAARKTAAFNAYTEVSVEISVGPKGIVKDLDIEIAGGRDDPYIPGNPGVFIVAVRPGSEAEKHLIPGNRITKIDGVDMSNVPSYVAQNLFRSGDGKVKISVMARNADEVSQSSSKMISWGTISLETFTENSDSGKGTDLSEKGSSISTANERLNITVAVGHRGELWPLDFEIYGGQDEPSIEGNPGIFIKELKSGSSMEKNVKVGDQIVKVNGTSVTNVPRHVFFNFLRKSEKVAKLQVLKTPEIKADMRIQVLEEEGATENEVVVQISTGPKGQLGQLGFKIQGGRDKPCVPGDPGIFIKEIKRGSVAEKVLGLGDKILKIDGTSVANVPFRFALDRIKKADQQVTLHIKKAALEHSELDESKTTRKKTAWKAIMSFSDEQLEEFHTAFKVYDRSEKGKISLKNTIDLCRSLGHNLAIHDVDLISTEYGFTGDGKISFIDFVNIINKIIASQRSETDLFEAFEVFDQEEKGFISVQEFEQALQEIPGSNDIPASEMMEIIAMADPDGDGHIKYEEFRELVLPLFHQY